MTGAPEAYGLENTGERSLPGADNAAEMSYDHIWKGAFNVTDKKIFKRHAGDLLAELGNLGW